MHLINTKGMQAITIQLGCVLCFLQSENIIRIEELHIIAAQTASNPLRLVLCINRLYEYQC
jgi:hypothetical protein